MQVLHSRAVHVAMHARAAIMQELDWQSGSKTQAKPCKKRCWNIDNSFISNSSASDSLRFDRIFHFDICSAASPLNVLARCTAHENLMVSIKSR